MTTAEFDADLDAKIAAHNARATARIREERATSDHAWIRRLSGNIKK